MLLEVPNDTIAIVLVQYVQPYDGNLVMQWRAFENAGAMPVERRSAAIVLRGLADELERQAEALEP